MLFSFSYTEIILPQFMCHLPLQDDIYGLLLCQMSVPTSDTFVPFNTFVFSFCHKLYIFVVINELLYDSVIIKILFSRLLVVNLTIYLILILFKSSDLKAFVEKQ